MDNAAGARREPFQRWFAWFETRIDPFAAYDRPQPPCELRAFVGWALRDARGAVWLLALFSLAVGAAEAGVFWLIGGLVDRAAAAGPERFLAEEWPWLAALLFAVLVLKPGAQLAQNAMTSLALGPSLNPMIVWRLHRHTLGQSMRYFEEDFTGRIAQKQMQTANALTSVLQDALTALGMLVSYVVTMLVVLGAADPWLAAVGALWCAAFVLSLRWAIPRIRERSRQRAEARATVTGRLVDSLSHIRTVKLFAHARREEDNARAALARYRDASVAFGRPMMAMRVILAALNAAVTVAMVGGALWLWTAGEATLGVIAMASMLTLRLTAMSSWIAFSALSIFGELGTIEDGAQTLSPAHEVTDRPGARDPAPVRGRILFDDVTFGYGRRVGGVRDLTLEIAPGEKVGLVGRSGAGKSTVVSLLLRLYDVEGGRILLDGVDIRDLSQDGLRKAVATVSQETAIFNRSARENILYGRPEATLDEAIAAARRARAHDFIETLRDGRGRTGYAAHLGERGVKLSGGQRQRIALARAILKDAPILVLDEATSALDSEVEAEIHEALVEAMQDKTVIAIAHRLSTIAAMDRIVVMDAGRVVEQGPHDALLAQGGLYADLWTRQSGGFLGDRAAEAAE
jgi:ATP-binding cassette subfamily B protein